MLVGPPACVAGWVAPASRRADERNGVAGRNEVNANIVAHYRTVARAIDRVMLPMLIELGLTMPQFKALIAVVSAGAGGIAVTELGAELSVGQPVRPGYVERISDASDRRRVLVTATKLGVEVTGELRLGRRSTFAEWLANVEDGDAEALERGLRALALAVQASPLGEAPVN